MAEQLENLGTEKLLDEAIARNEASLRRIHVCIEKSCKVLRRISKERAEANSGANAGRAGGSTLGLRPVRPAPQQPQPPSTYLTDLTIR